MTRLLVTCRLCLEVYALTRTAYGAVQTNACPHCGYVGWSPVSTLHLAKPTAPLVA